MGNLRAGLIGLGMMGRHHARVLGSLEGVDLVAVADPGGDPHHAAGGRPLVSSVEELVAAGLDYCMVAVPTIYHEPVATALAEAGASLADVVRAHYYLPRAEDWPAVAPLLGRYFGDIRPASTAVICGLVDPRMRIEIEVTARKRTS